MSRTMTIPAIVLMCALLPAARGQASAGASSPQHANRSTEQRSDGPRSALTHPRPADAARPPPIRIAITVDDLPGGGTESAGYTHVQIVKDIIAILQAHHVLHATGFVVGSMIEWRPARQEALDAWVHAGFEVGNHTFSHSSLDELGLDRYKQDIVADRPIVDALEKRTGQRHRYFRFPYLEEGRTESERKALRRLLAAEHYTVARVSLSFEDTDWADAYQRCLARGNNAALDALRKSYLENGIAALGWAVAASRDVFGHAIPQVLLVHANVPAARNLDALLTAYEQTGVRYIPLADALSEPAYQAYYPAGGKSFFDEASKRLGRPRPPQLVEPTELIDLVCP